MFILGKCVAGKNQEACIGSQRDINEKFQKMNSLSGSQNIPAENFGYNYVEASYSSNNSCNIQPSGFSYIVCAPAGCVNHGIEWS